MKTLETMDAKERKAAPVYSGVLKYFPDALVEVAILSKVGNDQHNPGEPLHWAKEKSTDEGDALVRHQLQAGTFDTDGVRHSAKVAWRALAQLQRELDAERNPNVVRGTDGVEALADIPFPAPSQILPEQFIDVGKHREIVVDGRVVKSNYCDKSEAQQSYDDNMKRLQRESDYEARAEQAYRDRDTRPQRVAPRATRNGNTK